MGNKTLRERIAFGECVSDFGTDRCPVCVDRCEASLFKNELNEVAKQSNIEIKDTKDDL